jgi:hypothetical protein
MPFVDSLGLEVPRGTLVTTDALAATETLNGALLPELVGVPARKLADVTKRVYGPPAPKRLCAQPEPRLQNQRGNAPPSPPMRCFGIATGRAKRVNTLVYVQVVIEGLARVVPTAAFDPRDRPLGVPFTIAAAQGELRAMPLTRGQEPLLMLLPRGPLPPAPQ